MPNRKNKDFEQDSPQKESLKVKVKCLNLLEILEFERTVALSLIIKTNKGACQKDSKECYHTWISNGRWEKLIIKTCLKSSMDDWENER